MKKRYDGVQGYVTVFVIIADGYFRCYFALDVKIVGDDVRNC